VYPIQRYLVPIVSLAATSCQFYCLYSKKLAIIQIQLHDNIGEAESHNNFVGDIVSNSEVGDSFNIVGEFVVGEGIGEDVGEFVASFVVGEVVGELVVGEGIGEDVGEFVASFVVGEVVGEFVVGEGIGEAVGEGVGESVDEGIGEDVGEFVAGEGIGHVPHVTGQTKGSCIRVPSGTSADSGEISKVQVKLATAVAHVNPA